jgi:hydrogenase nickel incorporation protein HypA/HybF
MHEMSLCESVVQIVEEHARTHKFSRVNKVRLEIGAFACVEPEALRFCFEVVTRGTLADGARLEILDLSGRAWCSVCGAEVTVRQRFDSCPTCGNEWLSPVGGDDLRIKDLEVE